MRVEPVVIANWQNLTYFTVALCIGLAAPAFAGLDISDKSLQFLLRPWVWPDVHRLVLLVIMGVLSTLASAGFIFAYRSAEANFVAPFEYTALLWAVVNGIVFFGDFPDSSTGTGAVIVIGAGIWMLWRAGSSNRYHVPTILMACRFRSVHRSGSRWPPMMAAMRMN